MLGGQPDTGHSSESYRNATVTSYQMRTRLAALDESKRVQMAVEESLKQEKTTEAMHQQENGIAVESQHANGYFGGEMKSEEAAEPTDVSVADESDYGENEWGGDEDSRSDDSGSEWGGDEESIVDADPSPRSVPLVAESSGGGDEVGHRSTGTAEAEAGNDSEAEKETQASQVTRELDALSMTRDNQMEARKEDTQSAINGGTASEPTDTVGKLASLEQGGGAPANLEEEIVHEGASSGGRDRGRSGAETCGSDHGSSCAQSLQGDSETTSERALERKAADVCDEFVKDEADSAPPGVGIEGGVTGHEQAKGEEASREATGESEAVSVAAGPDDRGSDTEGAHSRTE